MIEQLRDSQFEYPDIGKFPSDSVIEEIIQKLREGEELKMLVYEILSPLEELCIFIDATLDDDVEGESEFSMEDK